jgi:hypothetical protein
MSFLSVAVEILKLAEYFIFMQTEVFDKVTNAKMLRKKIPFRK